MRRGYASQIGAPRLTQLLASSMRFEELLESDEAKAMRPGTDGVSSGPSLYSESAESGAGN